jgi:hypothetical protein
MNSADNILAMTMKLTLEHAIDSSKPECTIIFIPEWEIKCLTHYN